CKANWIAKHADGVMRFHRGATSPPCPPGRPDSPIGPAWPFARLLVIRWPSRGPHCLQLFGVDDRNHLLHRPGTTKSQRTKPCRTDLKSVLHLDLRPSAGVLSVSSNTTPLDP